MRYVRHARRGTRPESRAAAMARNLRRRSPEPAPEEVIPRAGEQGARDGYHIEQSGTWYKLIGPDGTQVGRAQRSEEDAWRQIDG